MVLQQRAIFESALPFLKRDGRIVYATCSVLHEENEAQVAHFTAAHGLQVEGAPFASLPTVGGMDGLFAAVLRRRK